MSLVVDTFLRKQGGIMENFGIKMVYAKLSNFPVFILSEEFSVCPKVSQM